MRWARPGKLVSPVAMVASVEAERARAAATAAAAFCALCAPRSEPMPARSATRVDRAVGDREDVGAGRR